MSIIDGRPTSAYVVSAGDSEVLQIPDEVFWDRLSNVPGLVRNQQQELVAAGALQMDMLPRQTPFFPNPPQVDVHA